MHDQVIFQPYEFCDTRMLSENLLHYDKIILWISQATNLAYTMGLREFEKALEQGVFKFIDTNTHLDPKYNNQTKKECIKDSIDDLAGNFQSYFHHVDKDMSIKAAEEYSKCLANKCKNYLSFYDSGENHLYQTVANATIRDLTHLDVPVYFEDIVSNSIFTRQRLFTINLELAILDLMGVRDFVSTPDLMVLHAAKFQLKNILGEESSYLDSNQARSYIWDICKVEGIPDLSDCLSKNYISFDNILDNRETQDGVLFRNWFHDTIGEGKSVNDQVNIVETYYDAIKPNNNANSIGVKTLRIAIPTALSFLNPILGVAASCADGFLIEKLLNKWKPSFFIHDQLYASIAQKMYKPKK